MPYGGAASGKVRVPTEPVRDLRRPGRASMSSSRAAPSPPQRGFSPTTSHPTSIGWVTLALAPVAVSYYTQDVG